MADGGGGVTGKIGDSLKLLPTKFVVRRPNFSLNPIAITVAILK